MSVRTIADRVRRPEYTGENRCIPCTAVNLVIAGVLAVGLGVVSPPLGAVALAASLGSIYLRGYLVPGTPTLTKRYFPDWVLARFDQLPTDEHGPAFAPDGTEAGGHTAGESDHAATEGPVEPEVVLGEAGVIVPCTEEDDLCLDASFRAAWRERIAELRGSDVGAADAIAALGIDDLAGSLARYGDAVVLEREDGRSAGAQWESRAALLADVAAARLLDERIAGWDRLDAADRSRLLYSLRIFAETCPTCGGPVGLGAETVESCCRSHEVVAVTCGDCDARLFEQRRA
ncbi:hypothetical protein BRC90_07695 [Halobacteriales archaeon QS_4_69_34]|nr:MAG: hypothetical protein BRC90_07695 [Halobacteriales archaeon QS_4_69_34]